MARLYIKPPTTSDEDGKKSNLLVVLMLVGDRPVTQSVAIEYKMYPTDGLDPAKFCYPTESLTVFTGLAS